MRLYFALNADLSMLTWSQLKVLLCLHVYVSVQLSVTLVLKVFVKKKKFNGFKNVLYACLYKKKGKKTLLIIFL